MARATLIVTVDLDPIAGWGHEPEDFAALVQSHLEATVPHYYPRTIDVSVEPASSWSELVAASCQDAFFAKNARMAALGYGTEV